MRYVVTAVLVSFVLGFFISLGFQLVFGPAGIIPGVIISVLVGGLLGAWAVEKDVERW